MAICCAPLTTICFLFLYLFGVCQLAQFGSEKTCQYHIKSASQQFEIAIQMLIHVHPNLGLQMLHNFTTIHNYFTSFTTCTRAIKLIHSEPPRDLAFHALRAAIDGIDSGRLRSDTAKTKVSQNQKSNDHIDDPSNLWDFDGFLMIFELCRFGNWLAMTPN